MKRESLLAAVLLATATFFVQPAPAADIPHSSAPPIIPIQTEGERGPGVPDFKIKPGFKVTLAFDAPESRFMQFDNFNNLYVSAPKHGTITTYKLQPDGTYKQNAVVVEGKKTIHCMEFVDGWLWFSQTNALYKGKVREDGKGLDELTTILPEGSVPGGGSHWWRPILVTSDGFYTGMGDAKNFSDLEDPKIVADEGPHSEEREKIWKYSLDGKTKTLFASGVRNTEKLLFRPGTDEVWGCDQGSDWFGLLLGDDKNGHQPITNDIPGEEVNHYEQGKFYGHPYIADNNIVRPEYANKPNLQEWLSKATPPAYLIPAHYSVCGWIWLSKDSTFGKRGDMYIACHGSWNHVPKVSYCVLKIEFSPDGKPLHAEQIVNCLSADSATFNGRPVDIAEEPGTDNLLFSEDADGEKPSHSHVYRLSAVAAK